MSIRLVDDGTLDTVFDCEGVWVRFSQEYAASYRDADGVLDVEAFLWDNEEEIYETADAIRSHEGVS